MLCDMDRALALSRTQLRALVFPRWIGWLLVATLVLGVLAFAPFAPEAVQSLQGRSFARLWRNSDVDDMWLSISKAPLLYALSATADRYRFPSRLRSSFLFVTLVVAYLGHAAATIEMMNGSVFHLCSACKPRGDGVRRSERSEIMRPEGEGHEADEFERLLRAASQGDQHVWEELEHRLGEIVAGWLHDHPLCAEAFRGGSEAHYVALVLQRVRQASARRQLSCRTRSDALLALRVSLNGVILDSLRISFQPGAASSTPEPLESDVPTCAGDSGVEWDQLQSLLLAERERRLAYLLYHCGLRPAEIVRLYPREWSDRQEIARLRLTIMQRLLNSVNSLALSIDSREQIV
jgi:hypothetical protein